MSQDREFIVEILGKLYSDFFLKNSGFAIYNNWNGFEDDIPIIEIGSADDVNPFFSLNQNDEFFFDTASVEWEYYRFDHEEDENTLEIQQNLRRSYDELTSYWSTEEQKERRGKFMKDIYIIPDDELGVYDNYYFKVYSKLMDIPFRMKDLYGTDISVNSLYYLTLTYSRNIFPSGKIRDEFSFEVQKKYHDPSNILPIPRKVNDEFIFPGEITKACRD